MELVSCIITTCKRTPDIVMRAVESVIRQTYADIEILLIDDSPEDFPFREEVRRRAEELSVSSGKMIRYIPHEKCMGACAARNTGTENSHGEIIGFLDDDDEWLPEKVEKMVPLFSDPEVGLVYCHNIRIFDDTGKEEVIHRRDHGPYPYKEIVRGNYIGSTSFPLLRKKALQEIGGFDLEMQSAQDGDVWARLSLKYKVVLCDVVGVRYHVHSGVQISSDPKKKIAGLERFNEKNRECMEEYRDIYWIRYMKLIPFYLQDGQKNKALQAWKKAAKRCPEKIRGNLGYLKKILINNKGK